MSAGQAGAAFAEKGLVTLRQLIDEAFHLRRTGGGHHLGVVRRGSAVADIVQGVGGEDHRVLRDDRDLVAQIVQGQVADVPAIKADAAARYVVEPQQQLKDRGLARSGRPDQCHVLAGQDFQIDIVQGGDFGPCRVTEGDLFEADRRLLRLRQRLDSGGFSDGGFGAQQFQQAFSGAGGAHDVAPYLGDGSHAPRDQHRIENERSQLAVSHGAVVDLIGAYPQHEDDGAHDGGDHQGGQGGAHPGAGHGGGEARFGSIGEALALPLFLGVGLDRGHGIEDFAGQRRGVGDLVLGFPR